MADNPARHSGLSTFKEVYGRRVSDQTEGIVSVAQRINNAGPYTPSARAAQEKKFMVWYSGHARRLGLNPDPDAIEHHYDYRSAFRAGDEPDSSGHWSSRFKGPGHPRLIVDGINTRTGKPVRR